MGVGECGETQVGGGEGGGGESLALLVETLLG